MNAPIKQFADAGGGGGGGGDFHAPALKPLTPLRREIPQNRPGSAGPCSPRSPSLPPSRPLPPPT